MQLEELDVLIDKTATLMVQYERRSAQVEEHLRKLGETLQGLTRQLPAVVKGSTTQLLQTLPAEVNSTVRGGLERSLCDHRAGLQSAGADAERAAKVLAEHIDDLRKLHRLLVWKTLGAVAITLALLLAGGAWLSLHYASVVRENQLSATLVKAYNRADVVLCGRNELCANVDTRHARYGDRGQYLPVKPR